MGKIYKTIYIDESLWKGFRRTVLNLESGNWHGAISRKLEELIKAYIQKPQ